MGPNKDIGLVELSKECGLYSFKCKHCGRKNKGIEALRSLFDLVLKEVAKTKVVRIMGFGSFRLTRWKAPKTEITKGLIYIHRISFKPSKTAKAKVLESVKTKEE